MGMVEIYALCEPDTGAIRYIGKANSAAARLKRHVLDSRRRDYPVYRWMKKLAAKGQLPTLRILEVVEDWHSAERRLIAASRANGDRLLNVADGGDEPHCPPQVRSKNGRGLCERIYGGDENHAIEAFVHAAKKMLGTAHKRGDLSERVKQKMRLAAAKRPDMFGAWAAI